MPTDGDAAAILREKRRQAEMTTARMERDERIADGVYMLTSEARAAKAKVATLILGAIEGGLSDAANAIAERFPDVGGRDVQYILGRWLRSVRERMAEQFKAEAAAHAALISVDEDDETGEDGEG